MIFVSIVAIKILATAKAIFIPIAVPCGVFSIELERVLLKDKF